MIDELKGLIVMLLEDATRIQQLEPNAGTSARIQAAKKALASGVFDTLLMLVASNYRLAIAEAGYEYVIGADGSLIVRDPVQCSNGAFKWVEHKDVVLRSNDDAMQFLIERS
ncbi:hypothetical protein E5C31_18630 [Providencia rettgeri]|jgi:hypothetical protein|uniref:Uncharacterized protein n=5 Tax=Morganellaceae TaxID=1903414 RepID=A0A899NE19_PROST|nr:MULTISPECIES: hypothetical protein [Enterobacterales]QHP74520.1 hypothetical protein EKQ45_00350 [Proteus vulgaris]EKH6496386.1 hypothetical protein [Providencia rettgeri]ELB1110330.1 hypothetical protein [Morganella morganii]ELL8907335.1 hypothetical protein [Proteus mirabilis]ELQ1457911.1 hypothetical protein [Providencia rettgeri]